MNVSLPRSKRTIARLIGVLGLGSMLLVAIPAHAATSAPPGRIATNLPNVFAYPAPPSGFDPVRASITDLRRYGFPLPPDRVKAPKAYLSWVNVMHQAKHYVLPSFTTHRSIKHATSYNWSGAVDTRNVQNCFIVCFTPQPVEVWGAWRVPDVSASTQTSYSSTWVGLDGWGNGQVEQIGTEQQALSICFITCNIYTSYYAWWELYPDSEQMIGFPLFIRAGDYMYADVYYDRGSNQVSFFLQNDTTGFYVAFTTPAKYGCRCASAEWVTERPTVNGSLTALADFGHTNISDAYFRATSLWGTYTYPAISPSFNANTINMINGSGRTLAYGYAPYPDEVDSSWVNYN